MNLGDSGIFKVYFFFKKKEQRHFAAMFKNIFELFFSYVRTYVPFINWNQLTQKTKEKFV